MKGDTVVKALVYALLLTLLATGVEAQTSVAPKAPSTSKERVTKEKPSRKARGVQKAINVLKGDASFRPTYTFAEGTVGSYFYPRSVGSSWTMRTTSQLIDYDNKVVSADTLFSTERVISDSSKSLQHLPLLICESVSKRAKDTTTKRELVEYYVDDSLIMAVFNNSVSASLNKTLLVSPAQVGTAWRESADDSTRAQIVSMKENVVTPYATFDNALVVLTKLGMGELWKFFVPGKGLVKMTFRGPGPQGMGAFVVNSELVALTDGKLNGEAAVSGSFDAH